GSPAPPLFIDSNTPAATRPGTGAASSGTPAARFRPHPFALSPFPRCPAPPPRPRPAGTGLAQEVRRPEPGANRDALEGGARHSSVAGDETAAPARPVVSASAGRGPHRDPEPGLGGPRGDQPDRGAGAPGGRPDPARDRPGNVRHARIPAHRAESVPGALRSGPHRRGAGPGAPPPARPPARARVRRACHHSPDPEGARDGPRRLALRRPASGSGLRRADPGGAG